METIALIGKGRDISTYQSAYRSLIDICENHGTLVMEDRLLEEDKDVGPYKFFRKGTMEFIFPAQKARLIEYESSHIDPTAGYSLIAQIQVFEYDALLVNGIIRVEYKDTKNGPALKVSDVLAQTQLGKQSYLPPQVSEHLGQLVQQLSLK